MAKSGTELTGYYIETLRALGHQRGLLGAYVSYTHWDQYGDVQAAHAAGEFEAYWGRWTLRGIEPRACRGTHCRQVGR